MPLVRFDESLGVFASIIEEQIGADDLESGVILRDAVGMLCFVSKTEIEESKKVSMTKLVGECLGAYAQSDRPILSKEDVGAKTVLEDTSRALIQIGNKNCWIIDRRIVGAGWLEAPGGEISLPPRVVFASLKGGVGRSTALAIAASDFASRGMNVLVLDLDLEAPGLGELLLDESRTPKFGVVDYLVENGIGGIEDDELDDFVGLSQLTESAGGRIDVVPALGESSAQSPQNVLPKLARAMIEDVTSDGETVSVGSQISRMIERFTRRQEYDVVLIDSRAGLAELAAPAVLGLGAQVLLFGTAQRQTVSGYKALFAGLRLLANRAVQRGESADWRLMFKPVYAKSSLRPEIQAAYAADLYELFLENLYDAGGDVDFPGGGLSFLPDDPDAPHAPLLIPLDAKFADFDPKMNSDHLSRPFYEQTFRAFLDGLDAAIQNLRESAE